MRVRAERGSMTVEVAFLLVLLVVPLFYLVGTVGRIQAGAYAVTAAAREAGRAFVTAEDAAEASARAQVAAGLVYRAHGFEPRAGTVQLSCGQSGCLTPGGSVRADSQVSVELPLVPDFMRDRLPTTVTLTASHLETVDEFRAGTP